ncbi:MAG: hypothetical protein GX318_05440 [Clostridia bacterium]|nr:hypothetical protein [Clostridia bacterium]
MLKQPVEVYQIGDTTYLKESNHHQWMVIEENNIMEMEQFVTEVSPLSNFSFSVPEQVDYLGKERLEGRVHYILSCTPNVENRVLKMHWKNFKYKFWVDRRSKIITKSLILSEGSSDAKTTLEMLIELHDLNADFKIKAPKTDKSI